MFEDKYGETYLVYATDGEIVDVLGRRGERGGGVRRLHGGVFKLAEGDMQVC